ncbi:MAG: hypothetical protein SFT68_05610 [Rickettsiaceae bacterium]|nr:hypothetical protein [Rickettsiaceae bacterium]
MSKEEFLRKVNEIRQPITILIKDKIEINKLKKIFEEKKLNLIY